MKIPLELLLPYQLANTPYLDPSYGVTYHNEGDFENKAVFGYTEKDAWEKQGNYITYRVKRATGLNNIKFIPFE